MDRTITVTAHLVGINGPAVVVPARIAAILEKHADLTSLRVRARGVDQEASEVLMSLRIAAMSWRSSATGPTVAPMAEPEPSSQWLSTTEAAALLDISDRAIRKAIAEKRLPAVRAGTRWYISREDAEHYRAARAA